MCFKYFGPELVALFERGEGWGEEPLGGGAYLKEVGLWTVGLEIYHLILSTPCFLIDPGMNKQPHAQATTVKSHSHSCLPHHDGLYLQTRSLPPLSCFGWAFGHNNEKKN